MAFPIILASRFYNSLYYRTSRDNHTQPRKHERFKEFLGATVSTSIDRSRPNLTHESRLMVSTYLPNFIPRSVYAKKCQIVPYLSFCSGTTKSFRHKVEGGCTTTNIPLSNDTRIVSVFRLPDGEVVFTIFVIQNRDQQKTSNFFARWRLAIVVANSRCMTRNRINFP